MWPFRKRPGVGANFSAASATLESPLETIDLAQFGSFTPAEQACIKGHIQKKIDEGWEQDRAVAAAINICAPSKSTSKSSAVDPDDAEYVVVTFNAGGTLKLKGGNYSATDTGDGFFTIHDVPILSAVTENTKNAPFDVGMEWLSDAVRFGQEEYKRAKYCSPIHLTHSRSGGDDPKFAGYFLPKRVALFEVDGVPKPTVFADLKVTAEVFEDVQCGRLPYVSPEIHDWTARRIDSLALLAGKVPYHHYPLLTIGSIKKDSSAKFDTILNPMAGDKFAAHLEFSSRFAQMEQRCAKMESAIDRIEKTLVSGKPPSTNAAMGQNEEEGKEPANPCTRPLDATPVDPNEIPGVTQKLSNRGDSHMSADKKPDGANVAVPDAKFEARIAALEDNLKDRDKRDTNRTLEEKALKELEGYTVTDKTRQAIAKFAAMGEEPLKEFVAVYKEGRTKAPPPSLAAFEASLLQTPEVSKFEKLGPEIQKKAARFAAGFDTLKASGFPPSMSREEYVKIQLRMSGIEIPKEVA